MGAYDWEGVTMWVDGFKTDAGQGSLTEPLQKLWWHCRAWQRYTARRGSERLETALFVNFVVWVLVLC